MPGPVDLGYLFGLPPAEALAYFRAKGFRISDSWLDVWQEEHARVFTIARMAQQDLLEETREFIDRALSEGIPTEKAARELEEHLADAGWWGKKKVVGPDGVEREVLLGTPHRVRTILRTNINTACGAGRYRRQVETAAARPYWRYSAILDGSTRPSHRELDGKVFRADDPIWDRIYPPNGFGCRCRVRAISEREARREGVEVLSGQAGLGGFTLDPGWAYNPGKVDWPIAS